jgi:hypothetical protein
MIRTRRSWLVIVALVAVVIRPVAGAEDVRFRWAFGAVTGAGKARHFVRITEDVTLRSGDEVQMFVSPLTACYIYVLHEDPAGAITPLFPATAGEFPANYGVAREYYLPEAGQWLTLDTVTGTERVYLIASVERLTRLEAVLKGPRPQPDLSASAKAIVAELARLAKQQTSHWSERPVTMGGQVRGTPGQPNHPDLAAHASEISAPGFFARVFVIDHR